MAYNEEAAAITAAAGWKGRAATNWRKFAAIAAVSASPVFAVPAHADGGGHDDDPTTAVCGAFNLGLSPEQIADGLRRNDARYN